MLRRSEYEVELDTTIPSVVYANESLSLEKTAIEEAKTFSSLDGLNHLSFTPDFHKGAGTPVGTVALCDRVYPRVVGGDIGCGMRLDITGLYASDITDKVVRDLMPKLRHAFFEGGREVFSDHSRVLTTGFTGHDEGMDRRHVFCGTPSPSPVLESYWGMGYGRDNFLGTIGGGNHFVELQVVDEVVDKTAAWEAGLRVGMVCIMCHSGSLDLGQAVITVFGDRAKAAHKGRHPDHKFFALDEQQSEEYLNASHNAALFAVANRRTMAQMVASTLQTKLKPVYDAPHNLVWRGRDGGYLHRKGSCPANVDELVIIPGSMGTRSCLAIGTGFQGTLGSSPHGAGRVLNRNASRALDEVEKLNVVTKVDLKTARSDVRKELEKNLNEEAPRAYKDITAVIDSVVGAGIARPVAWLKPLLTIKG